jgi:hypothetical protein
MKIYNERTTSSCVIITRNLDTTICNLAIYNSFKVDLLCLGINQNINEKYSLQSSDN